MNSSLLLLFLLQIVLVHQSRGYSIWENFRNWKPKDPLICYRALTLELFENLKEVADKFYVEKGQKDFESKVKPRTFLSFFNQSDSNDESFKIRKKEAEKIAGQGISTIRQWLKHDCSDEKQKKVMKFTERFKEGSTKCGDAEYLSISIMLLEQACPEEGKEGFANGKPTFAWKNQIHGWDGIDPWASVL